jgi:putative acetyltransferase
VDHFSLEAEDRRQREDPVRAFLEPGGEILIAELDGRAVGCVAIVPDGTGA